MHHCGIRNNAEVAALPGDSRLAQGHDVIFGRNFFFDTPVEILVLAEDHRIVVANRGLDETLRVVGARGANHFQARRVDKPHLWILRVKWTAVDVAAARPANHERRGRIPTIVRFRHHIHDLVKSAADEIHELELDYGTHARERRSERCAHDGGFRDRRINYALGPEAVDEAVRHFESAAVDADVLANTEDTGIA